MSGPLITVIIGAYNAERYLAEAIDSVLAQTYRNLELIVVDDGSTDRTGEIAESYGEPVRCIRQENGGMAASRNRAIPEARGDYLAFLDAEAATGWFWMPDANGLPYWDYTAPFRHLLGWWLDAQGLRQVHGGAVGTEQGGVLLVGAGGSGKSTTALSTLLDERLRYAGDDYVAVGSAPAPAVHSLYCSGKVHPADLHRLPHLEPALADGARPDEKAVFYVEQAFPGRSIAGFPLRAIVVPRVTDRRAARAVPGTRAEALAALAPSTIFQLHPPARDALAWMAGLVRAVPTFVLELGSDVETIPSELLRIVER